MRLFQRVLVALCLGVLGGSVFASLSLAQRLDRSGLVPTFRDEFESFSWYAEDAATGKKGGGVWRTQLGYGNPKVPESRSLPSNKEEQIYTDTLFRGTGDTALGLNPFKVENGVLTIVAEHAPDEALAHMWGRRYTSGMISSKFTFSQKYGLFEIRAKLPRGRGLWPAFWLVPVDNRWPPEVDIFEVIGHEPTKLHTSLHSKAPGFKRNDHVATDVPDTSRDFHVYSFEWTPEEVVWYFDDQEVMRRPTPTDLNSPVYMIANLAVGGGWPGSPDATTHFPAEMKIDWIRAYRRGEASR